IRTGLVTHEPAPEPIVFAIEHPEEYRPLGVGSLLPPVRQPALEQLVQLAHATPAAPADPAELDFGIGVRSGHGKRTTTGGGPILAGAPPQRRRDHGHRIRRPHPRAA